MGVSPTRDRLENRYTEYCAELLRLEAEQLRLKRRAKAALADSAHDPHAARTAAELQRRLDQVHDQAAGVRAQVRVLRAGLDSAQVPAEAT